MSVPTVDPAPASVPGEGSGGGVDPSARRRAGLRATAGDMVRSILAVVAVVALIVLFVPRPSSVPPASVDLPAAVAGAQSQLGFTPAAPVPAGWTVTSTRVRRDTADLATWTVNYLTPQGRYVGLFQTAGYDPRWLSSLNQGGRSKGTLDVGGRTWEAYDKQEKEVYSLLYRAPSLSTLVLAKSGGEADARALAESLRSGL